MRAMVRAIAKPYFPASDHNRLVGERLRNTLGQDRNSVRVALDKTYDPESFSDSLMMLAETISALLGTSQRVIFLIDEAETLVVPYNQGGSKKIELEQLLQSLREVSQTTTNVGIVLSGSNHITEFAREYKNAFFGSCARVELSGITEPSDAERLISPPQVRPFVQFDSDAVAYGTTLCAGMPQFMWQIGAATAARVRGGPAVRGDIRSSVGALVNGRPDDLPFKPYDVLEPLEHMLSLQGERERDLLWLLLRRVALHSSLANIQVARHFIVDQTLLDLNSKENWNKRLRLLGELNVLTVGNSLVDLPPARRSRARFSMPQYSAQTIAASPSRSAGESADGRNRTCSGSSSASADSSTPRACLISDRIPSDSGFASAGSPHAFHFIGGRNGCCWPSGRVMRYSITHAVNQ